MVVKKITIIEFTTNITESGLSFEQKVIKAFKKVLSPDVTYEITEFAARLYKCTYCQPLQRFTFDKYPELQSLKDGNTSPFQIIENIDIRLLP